MQGIVIQGPTNYCREIIECYENIPNIVFSTWDDEPQENIEYIKSKGVDIIQSTKPTFSGYLNIIILIGRMVVVLALFYQQVWCLLVSKIYLELRHY
jgi:hypothetical protein